MRRLPSFPVLHRVRRACAIVTGSGFLEGIITSIDSGAYLFICKVYLVKLKVGFRGGSLEHPRQ